MFHQVFDLLTPKEVNYDVTMDVTMDVNGKFGMISWKTGLSEISVVTSLEQHTEVNPNRGMAAK